MSSDLLKILSMKNNKQKKNHNRPSWRATGNWWLLGQLWFVSLKIGAIWETTLDIVEGSVTVSAAFKTLHSSMMA